jgi:uncharacterized protein YqjF (DUF2071 family)/hemerythrin-like domain-containing protein
MLQNWCQISFLHWCCDPDVLQSRLPPGLTIDTFDHLAWVGLTPFRLTGLRLPFMPPLPWLSAFPETNLRTYVMGPAGSGIWFFSLDAARLPAVLGARLAYGLPYYWATMQVRRTGQRVEYTSARSGAKTAIVVEVGEALPDPDPLALFLTERYRLYTRWLGQLAVASVEHAPWPLHRATVPRLTETLRRAAGLPSHDAPALVHYSPGVHVRVGGLRRIRCERPEPGPRREGTLMATTKKSQGKDAIALLKDDHQKVRDLLRQLEATTERAASKRQKLLATIEQELTIHTKIEEQIFYPAFREAGEKKGDKTLYYEAIEEHHVVDLVLPEIKDTKVDSEEFGAKAKVLKDLVEHHAEEEETQMFPRAKKLIAREDLVRLGSELAQAKKSLAGSP